jgi:acetyl esterase/lipase
MKQSTILDASLDPAIDPLVRPFLKELNKDSSPFWELPGEQVRSILTGLQAKTPVDMSGVTIEKKKIFRDGQSVLLYIMRPEAVTTKLPVLFFIHGGVWIAGNFENHKRLVRDLVVGANVVAVFVEYTPIPEAVYPTQLYEIYTALEWVAENGDQINADPGKLAVCGNSVGGNMSAAISLMAKDKEGPKISLQILLYPATDANCDSQSYDAYAEGRFLSKAFMQYGWDIYAPDEQTKKERYASPLLATVEQLRGLPPALIQTAENCPLRDEGEAYGRKMQEAGVDVTITRYLGMIHDFGLLNGLRAVPATISSILQVTAELQKRLK